MDISASAMRHTLKTGKPLLQALSQQVVVPPPFWLMRQAGRYLPEYRHLRSQAGGFLEACYHPETAKELSLQPLRRYTMDGVILFSDILTIPNALGRHVAFVEGRGPSLQPLTNRDEVEALDVKGIPKRLAPVLEAIDKLAAALPATTALIGFCGAPWTLATYMIEGGSSRDHAKTREYAYAQRETFQALIDILVNACSAYLISQIDHGAEAVQIFDSWADCLPEREFQTWVIDPTRKIVDAVKCAHPAVPIIGFPRGAGPKYQAFVSETRVDAVNIDVSIPPEWAARTLQPLCTVQGNLDPMALVVGGDALDAAINRILAALSDGPFVFNLGHGVAPNTPPQNVAHLAERLRSFRS